MSEPVNLADFERLAQERLDPATWDYYAGGADDERTLRAAPEAFARIALRPRVLVDVTARDPQTTVFGRRLEHPIIIAPTAAHHLAHPDGELGTASGAAAAGALYTLSTISSRTLEEVAAAAPDAPRWFQLYTPPSRELTAHLVQRAADAGYGALVLTVDLPLGGNRERDVRRGFTVPLGTLLPEEQPVDAHGLLQETANDWDFLAWLRTVCPIPLLVKGVLRTDDALRALDAGCDGIWVSNHGGRQVDTAIAAIDALPEVAEAVAGRGVVVVDGGVRRGTDVLKALALGANLVAVGRPVLWGLAVDGSAGVRQVLEILRSEFLRAMGLTGSRTVDEITRDLVAVHRLH